MKSFDSKFVSSSIKRRMSRNVSSSAADSRLSLPVLQRAYVCIVWRHASYIRRLSPCPAQMLFSHLFGWYCLNIEQTDLECVYAYNHGKAATDSVHVMYSGLECFASDQPHNMILRYLFEQWPLLLQPLLQCNKTYHTTYRHFSLFMMPH